MASTMAQMQARLKSQQAAKRKTRREEPKTLAGKQAALKARKAAERAPPVEVITTPPVTIKPPQQIPIEKLRVILASEQEPIKVPATYTIPDVTLPPKPTYIPPVPTPKRSLYERADIAVGGLLPGGLSPVEVREIEAERERKETLLQAGARAIEEERERLITKEDLTLSERQIQAEMGFQKPVIEILSTGETIIRQPELITAPIQEFIEEPKTYLKKAYTWADPLLGGYLPGGRTPKDVKYEETLIAKGIIKGKELITIAKEEPLYAAGALAGEVALMAVGGKLAQKTTQTISKTATHLNPKLTKIIKKDGKDIIKVGDVDIEIVGPGLEKVSVTLEKQARLAGKKVHGVSAAQDLMGTLKGKIIVRKPIPNEAKLTTPTKTLLKKFDEEKITPTELVKLDQAIKVETGSKGLLERSFFMDPYTRARISRLGIRETKEGSLYDLLTGKAKLMPSKPQIILFKDIPIERFPTKLRDIEIKLKKGVPLTETEAVRLKQWQMVPTEKAKPIGFLGKEAEITLAPGEIFVKKGLARPVFIEGKKVKIYQAEIKKATPETRILLAKSRRGELDLKGENLLKRRLERETGLVYSPVSKKLYYSPFKPIGSTVALISRPSILKDKIPSRVIPPRDTSKILSGKTTLLKSKPSMPISPRKVTPYKAPIGFSKSTIVTKPSKPIPSKPSSPILSPTIKSPFFKPPVSRPPISPPVSKPPISPPISKVPPGYPGYSPPYSPPRYPPKVPPTKPPIVPFFRKAKKRLRTAREREPIFQAQVRKKDKWIDYGARGPKKQVVKRTKEHLDTTLAASMRVKNIRTKKFVGLKPTRRYRHSKKDKGTILIEKRKYRLSTKPEVKDIHRYRKPIKRKKRNKK